MTVVQLYQDLLGGEGRKARFRPERYKARHRFPAVQPSATIESVGSGLAIRDISLNGFAVSVNSGATVPELNTIVQAQIGFDGATTFEGAAEVVRVEEHSGVARTIGLRVVDGVLDLNAMIATHDRLEANWQLDQSIVEAQQLISNDYRRHVADTVNILRTYRNILDRYEDEARTGDLGAATRLTEMEAQCKERIMPTWRTLWREGAAIAQGLLSDRRSFLAAKRFTETVLTPELVAGPVWRQAYEKPLGYPGDFRLMSMIYTWQNEGETAYGRLCHHFGLEVAKPAGTRLALVVDSLREIVGSPTDEVQHVTSLGCGPSWEVAEFLQTAQPGVKVNFTLIDQDHIALSDAHERAYRASLQSQAEVDVQCLHLSFSQLLRQPDLVAKLPRQNLIYCVGLVDYLPKAQAQMLVAGLFAKLEEGGQLIIGNMKGGTDLFWPAGFILDWELIYRSEREMMELAAHFEPKNARLDVDQSGYNWLLFLDK